jgi:hypothetical protein
MLAKTPRATKSAQDSNDAQAVLVKTANVTRATKPVQG